MESIVQKDQMAEYARTLTSQINVHKDGATVITLSGDLGAGKTTLTQEIARVLGVQDVVSSPTFVLEKVYQLENQKWQRLIHIDAYRLVSADELHGIGWDEIISDVENLVIVEWPEKITSAIPSHAARVVLEGTGDERHITYGEN